MFPKPLFSQDRNPVLSTDNIDISLAMTAWFPKLLERDAGISSVIGSTLWASLLHIDSTSLMIKAGAHSIQTETNKNLTYLSGALGLGYTKQLSERLSLRGSAFAGLGQIPDIQMPEAEDKSYGVYELSAGVDAAYRLTAAFQLILSTGVQRLATPTADFITAPSIGIGFQISPGEVSRKRGEVEFGTVKASPVFPVLRSWYDANSIGTVSLQNLEKGPIENVRVYFQVPEYMSGPRLCASKERLEEGESLGSSLFGVFDERILSLTENSKSNAIVEVRYSYYGSRKNAQKTFPLEIFHRNTMTWKDDRRAAAFVSPTDPASLWFSRYAGSVARDRRRTSLPYNLQFALSVFEALRLYGVNYVIDPNSSYIELSKNASAIDFLQYPSETLTYRGGDCDDLSILFCSLLESSGISTAFITIPGHIYMAFDLGISKEEALEQFFDPGLLVFREGRAWAPVEITLVQAGFVKAWRIGAKQWIDNEDSANAAFFPMKENWAIYPPSALPHAESRFALPAESEMIVAFDESINRFVKREMGPVIEDFEKRLSDKRDPEILNEYGIVLAKAGMLDEAWEKLAEAADLGYSRAWNNLASIAFIRKDYKLSYSYYEWAKKLLPSDPLSDLGLARSSYEMDRYSESEKHYNELLSGAPELAGQFSYLASVYGGEGRAWSMADRLSTTYWSRPEPVLAAEAEEKKEVMTSEEFTAPPAEAKIEEQKAQEPATPPAAPAIAEKAPEDMDLLVLNGEERLEDAKGQEEITPAPADSAPSPPKIRERAPDDKDISEAQKMESSGPAAPRARPPEKEETSMPQPVAVKIVETQPENLYAPFEPAEPSAPRGIAASELPVEHEPPKEDIKPPKPVEQINPIDFLDPRVRIANGSWEREIKLAEMTDKKAGYAKLVLPPQPLNGPVEYRFSARSTGSGLVGFGIHINGRFPENSAKWDLSRYGGGDSLLVWITSDPQYYGDPAPRLQIYRSYNEVKMELENSVRIPGSAYDAREYRIAYDPRRGSIEVYVDGSEYLSEEGFDSPGRVDYLLLRALDSAEFENLRIMY